MLAWFPDDETCLDYVGWLRWPMGFGCPACGATVGWQLGGGRRECAGCGRQTSVTASTLFYRTRTPLTVWFAAAWSPTTQKHGASTLGLQRVLSLGSYQTAWEAPLSSRMVRPGREHLSADLRTWRG
ncbi:MAG: transposase [Candidatus Dormibacteria bacterium]